MGRPRARELYTIYMREFRISLPDKVAERAQWAIDSGWFGNVDDLVRAALSEYLDEHHLNAIEQQQLEDVEWVRGLSDKKRAG